MSTHEERLNKAIHEVTDKLLSMTKEEFEDELEKHRDSSIAKAFYYAWNPEWDGEWDD